MSHVRAEATPARFMDLYGRDEVVPGDIDDFVTRWHSAQEPWAGDMSLHAYLGLTSDEYQVWVYDPEAPPSILAARRSKRSLRAVMAERLDHLVSAGHPEDETTIHGLRAWLEDSKER